jgi:hypothetical protein
MPYLLPWVRMLVTQREVNDSLVFIPPDADGSPEWQRTHW